MNGQNLIKAINKLVSICEIDNDMNSFDNEPYKSFLLGANSFSFIGSEHLQILEISTHELYKFKKNISETWTIKKFESKLFNLIGYLKGNNKECSNDEFDSFFNSFIEPDIYESEVLYELWGAKMDVSKLEFGDFTIYNYNDTILELIQKYPILGSKSIYFSNRKSEHLVSIKVKARENDKAVEIANDLALKFDNVFSYMIGDLTHQNEVSIFDYRGWNWIQTVICNNTNMGKHGKAIHVSLPVDIANPHFNDPKVGNDKIWKLVTKSNKSEIENRLLTAIEWVGKAVHDLDTSKSLVQFIFAIECLLQYNEKALINPSIVAQLSDSLAFIICDDLQSRKDIVKTFKDLYQKRSAIAHGASATINLEDLRWARGITTDLIISLLTHSPYCEMKTMKELNDHLIDMKFK